MNRITEFFKGKGFYLALAVCIMAAAGSSFWAIHNVMNSMNEGEKPIRQQGGMEEWQKPQVQVEQKVNDLPKPSERPSQSLPLPSGSSAAPQPDTAQPEPVEQSVPSFVKPVDGQITKPFSGDELVYNETLGDWRTHNGLDISCAQGAAVRSAVAGTVCNIYEDGMWGQVVDVESDKMTWRYTGLEPGTVSVKVGDAVQPGTPLGKIGEITAEVGQGTHLHLEILRDGSPVDPEHYMKNEE